MRRPDPAATVALIPGAVAATAAICGQYATAVVAAFIAACLLALFRTVVHEPAPDDLEALADATCEPRVCIPDYVPAEWVKEAGR